MTRPKFAQITVVYDGKRHRFSGFDQAVPYMLPWRVPLKFFVREVLRVGDKVEKMLTA